MAGFMDVADRSRARVEERLTRLESKFDAPTVTQTTFEVGEERYQRAVEQSRGGQLDVRTVVRDDDGSVLLREGDGEWTIPSGQTRPGESPEAAAERVVSETADVDCSVTDAVSANISGVRNGDDESAETVYQLSLVFAAELIDSPDATDGAVRWDADAVSEIA